MRIVLITAVLFFTNLLTAQIKVVGYLPAYRWQLLSQLDYTHMTHLCAAFANPDEDGNMMFDQDLEQFVKVCHKNGTIALISICGGGDYSWGEKYKIYENLLESPESRTAFIHKIMHFVRESKLDGLDNDMEGKALELPNYNVFSQELADSLHAEGLLYTAALGVNGQWGAGHLTDLTLEKMDFVMTMSYGGVGHWNWQRKPNEANMAKYETDVQYFLDRKYDSSKVVGGVPFYYTEFPQTAQSNYGAYNKTNCEVYSNPDYLAKMKKGQDTLYTSEGNVIYINTPKMYEEKIDIAIKNKGGIMIWEVGQDCFDGNFSIIKHIGKYIDSRGVGLNVQFLSKQVTVVDNKGGKYLSTPFKVKKVSYQTTEGIMLSSMKKLDLNTLPDGETELLFDLGNGKQFKYKYSK